LADDDLVHMSLPSSLTPVAVKVFKPNFPQHFILDEVRMLSLIESELHQPVGGALIPRVVFSRENLNYFGMVPVGSPLTTESFRRHHISQLCATLKALHAHGIVHRDLRVRNLALVPENVALLIESNQAVSNFREKSSKSSRGGSIILESATRVMILDFGCSLHHPSRSDRYSGAFIEASRRVSTHLLASANDSDHSEAHDFVFCPSDDLESLVYLTFSVCFPQVIKSQLGELVSLRTNKPEDIDRVQRFWVKVFGMAPQACAEPAGDQGSSSSRSRTLGVSVSMTAGASWREALIAARAGDHDAVERCLLQAIPFLGI
jgi:serine/threonine protein kinase